MNEVVEMLEEILLRLKRLERKLDAVGTGGGNGEQQ